MKVEITKFGTTVIVADEGKTLIGIDNSMSKKIFLAKSDRVENYREINDNESTSIEEEMNSVNNIVSY